MSPGSMLRGCISTWINVTYRVQALCLEPGSRGCERALLYWFSTNDPYSQALLAPRPFIFNHRGSGSRSLDESQPRVREPHRVSTPVASLNRYEFHGTSESPAKRGGRLWLDELVICQDFVSVTRCTSMRLCCRRVPTPCPYRS